ncbi:O-antigen ligase family protein [Bosea sp. BIWAKO-01]|uniref:O-antigen ligase family protein n=1 Tax=Bosea sp. BIWAKO-01 TaxID=506668 RepID=UPI00086B8BE9|nr:O-antigen ligase family protein [Bosea sp. BIWAKO-01]GAU80623.1 lipid A core - O-antigen ligase and related enzymes [Bosea sp. BIWAKO-01]
MSMSLNLNSPGGDRMMIAAPSSSRQAVRLVALGGILMVALPLAMWAANRSAPLMLGLSAAAFLAAAVASGDAGALLRRMLAGLRSPIGLILTAFLGWALISLLWTHRPAFGFAAWVELLLPLGFALVIAASASFRPKQALVRALAMCLILASALIWFEVQSGLALRTALGVGKQASFIFNRPVIACLVLLAPVAHLLWNGSSKPVADRLLAAATAVAVSGIILYAESGAAKLGLGILILAWLLARLLPRLTLAATALGFAATLVLAPVIGPLADRALPPVLYEQTADAHSRDRVEIWLSFGEAIAARPFFGSGFGSSSALQTNPVAEQVSPQHRWLLAVGHPHSAPIQLWTETGIVGAALLLVAGLLFLRRLGALSARELAPRLALFASAFVMASVGHGAWQGWWIAVLAAAALWFESGRNLGRGAEHG